MDKVKVVITPKVTPDTVYSKICEPSNGRRIYRDDALAAFRYQLNDPTYSKMAMTLFMKEKGHKVIKSHQGLYYRNVRLLERAPTPEPVVEPLVEPTPEPVVEPPVPKPRKFNLIVADRSGRWF
jgi:hypothetical protein